MTTDNQNSRFYVRKLGSGHNSLELEVNRLTLAEANRIQAIKDQIADHHVQEQRRTGGDSQTVLEFYLQHPDELEASVRKLEGYNHEIDDLVRTKEIEVYRQEVIMWQDEVIKGIPQGYVPLTPSTPFPGNKSSKYYVTKVDGTNDMMTFEAVLLTSEDAKRVADILIEGDSPEQKAKIRTMLNYKNILCYGLIDEKVDLSMGNILERIPALYTRIR